MQNLVLALRNIGRNRRRSLVTILAIAVSCGGLALFGGYVSWTFRAVEEQTVGSYGHIQIYQRGYYDHGTGNPAAHAIDDYEKVRQLLLRDPVIAPMLELVTGQILFNGMVTAPQSQSASTFAGLGVFPAEDEQLTTWNPYGITRAETIAANAKLFAGPKELAEDDIAGCGVGIGLGKILRIGEALEDDGPKVPEAPAPPGGGGGVDLAFLNSQAVPGESRPRAEPEVDLLVAPPAGGMPNAATLRVRKLVPRATKELEDTLIKMPIKQASSLLFPGLPLHVTAVVVLLKRTEDTPAVAARIQALIDEKKLDLELKRWEEIRPFFLRMTRMIGLIFDFVFVLLVFMIAFLIYSTQSAGIMERLGEIGTLRAMGMTRFGLWRMLVLEGLVLGFIGGVIGVALAVLGERVIGAANIVYVPPTVTFHAKLEVLVLRNPIVLLRAFLGSLACAAVSSALPARRAARMGIADALRHP